ncbi:hypothetical protein ACHMW7_16300 [Aminobacter sp. UC22_36]|uniref:hypothetical protein n=1 Tax=Aminobacter sp. UC22_36 TaxID=3374549 RepID=UPI003756A32E
MPQYQITGSDGRKYKVSGSSPEGAVAALKKHIGSAPSDSSVEGARRDSASDYSRLSDEDRASPIPDALIESGKAIVNDAGKRSMGEDIIRSLGSGLRSGVESTIGMFGDAAKMQGDIAAWGAKKLGASDETAENVRLAGRTLSPGALMASTEDVQSVTTPVVGEHYQPETKAGEYVRTIGEFAPAVAAGPGRLGQKVALTVVPAVASEAAGQATKGTAYEKYARAAAALVAGAPIAFFGAGKLSGETIARAVEDATPQQIDRAEQLFHEAQAAGTPITRFEAVQEVTGGASRAGDIQRVVEGQGGGREFFAARPEQVEAAARREFGAIDPAPVNPSGIGPAAAETASDLVNDARTVINRVTEPFYTRAEATRLSQPEFQRVQAAPGWEEARNAIRNDPQLARYVEGMPDDSVGFLNEVQKYLRQQADNAAGPTNAQRNQQRSAGYGSDATVVRNAAEAASPDFRTAVNAQADLRRQYLDPILQGPIGKLAKDDVTTKEAVEALFPKNPLPNSEAEIGRTVAALAARRPSVARQLVRAHLESTFNQATRELQAGANQWGGAGFAAAVRGNPQQAANLQAAITALPNGQALWRGFDRFLNILHAQGTRQRVGSQTAFNQEIQQDLKRGSALGTGLTVASGGGLAWPKKALEVVERWRLGRNVSQIADLITNPESGAEFRRLATATSGQAMRNIAVSLTLQAKAGGTSGGPGAANHRSHESAVAKPANKVD